MPGGRKRSEDEALFLDLSPVHALVAAMFRYAVQDARSQAKASRYDSQRRENARSWLCDKIAVTYWLDLAGLPETTYETLLKEAGLWSHMAL